MSSKRHSVAGLLLAGAWYVAASPALADGSTYVCDIWAGSDEYVPREVSQIMKLVPGGAVEACDSPWGLASVYYAITMPEPGIPGICQARERPVFEFGAGGGWTLVPPEEGKYVFQSVTLMLKAEQPCPSPREATYVRTAKVSQELFLRFVEFWSAAISSGESFTTAFGNLPSEIEESEAYRKLAMLFDGRDEAKGLAPLVGLGQHEGKDGSPTYLSATLRGRDGHWMIDFLPQGEGFTALKVCFAESDVCR